MFSVHSVNYGCPRLLVVVVLLVNILIAIPVLQFLAAQVIKSLTLFLSCVLVNQIQIGMELPVLHVLLAISGIIKLIIVSAIMDLSLMGINA